MGDKDGMNFYMGQPQKLEKRLSLLMKLDETTYPDVMVTYFVSASKCAINVY